MRHAAVLVALLVDNSVVLAVAAGGDQGQHHTRFIRRQAAEMLRLRQLQRRQGGDLHPGPAAGGGKGGFVEQPAFNTEFLAAGIDLGDRAVTRHGAADQLAHVGSVLKAAPVDWVRAQQPPRQLSQEGHLTDQIGAFEMGAAGFVEAHEVVARFGGGAVGCLEAVEHRQHQGVPCRQAVEMALVGLGGQIHDRVDAGEGPFRLGRIRVGAPEVAAEAEQGVHRPGVGGRDQGAGVVAGNGAEGPAQQRLQGLPQLRAQLHGDPHRAKALHIGVAADRHRARAGLAHVAAQQGGVGDGVHIAGAVGVVGDAHRPGEHHTFGASDRGSGMGQLLAAEAAAGRDRLPGGGTGLLQHRLPAFGVVRQEVAADLIGLQQRLLDPHEHGGVAAGSRLQEDRGDR